MILGRRSAQPPITRCQRRQAVIRRLNSRSSRSVFVRVNLHQVSIFHAFRCEARRDEVMRTALTPAASPLRSVGGQKALSPRRWSIIHQRITVRISATAGRTSRRLKITLRGVSPALKNTLMINSLMNLEPIEKMSANYLAISRFIFHFCYIPVINPAINIWTGSSQDRLLNEIVCLHTELFNLI